MERGLITELDLFTRSNQKDYHFSKVYKTLDIYCNSLLLQESFRIYTVLRQFFFIFHPNKFLYLLYRGLFINNIWLKNCSYAA